MRVRTYSFLSSGSAFRQSQRNSVSRSCLCRASVELRQSSSHPQLRLGCCCRQRRSGRLVSVDQTTVPTTVQPPDQSTLLYSPPRHKYLARTPFHLSSKTRSHSHSVASEDMYKSTERLSPALLFGERRPPWRKQHKRLTTSTDRL